MLDLEPIVMQQVAQSMVFQLRDSVIQVDTFITPEELRSQYEAEAPDVEIRARHIMLTRPLQATPAQMDSVVAALAGIRDRIAGGARFETMAMQFSQDPGTADRGGDLGFFSRGEMVAPFEQAALELGIGEVSEVVETPMGYHLIRVDERRVQDFDDIAPAYRRRVQARMVAEAEGAYVEGLEQNAQPEVTEGAEAVTREMAENPATQLSGRASSRALVRWANGAVTVGEVRTIFQMESEEARAALAGATDEDARAFLEGLARRDLLIEAARVEGLQPGRDSIQALETNAKTQLRAAARMLGLMDLEAAPGERPEAAIGRAVERALQDNLSGAKQVVPLGLVGFQLREGTTRGINSENVGRVVLQVAQRRANRGLSPIEQAIDSSATGDAGGGS
jgi:hypothetical protein